MSKPNLLVLVPALLSAAACAGNSSSASHMDFGFSGPFACGELTCTAEQICLVTERARYTVPAEQTYECVAPPAGCDASMLCDCDYPDPYDGKPVSVCSVLGERILYLTDVSCGSGPACTDAQVCLLVGSADEVVTADTEASCVALPTDCTVSFEFCSTTCPDTVASEAGATRTFCSSSDFGVAVWIE